MVLSVRSGVGGCLCPRSHSVARIIAPICAFSNITASSASLADASTFLNICHNMCIGALCMALVGSLGKSERKKYPPALRFAFGSDKNDASV